MGTKRSKSVFERIKEESRALRGSIAEELDSDRPEFSAHNVRLLKFHGVFQQDDRDVRIQRREAGLDRQYEFMVRIRPPGGQLTAEQLLGVLRLAEEFGDRTVRITARQGLQAFGLQKAQLRTALQHISALGLTTWSAAGDVNCNVMCCPAPNHRNTVHRQIVATVREISQALMPRTTAYDEIWLNGHGSSGHPVADGPGEGIDGPLYGKAYLPHKLKIGVSMPEDNCTDVASHDIGLLAVEKDGKLVGYNVLVGGSMGTILGAPHSFPAIGEPVAFISVEQALSLIRAIVQVYRDFGDRTDRARGRLKYLIDDWGLGRFRQTVEQRWGRALEDPRPIEIVGLEDHLGWHEQGDGNWYLGLFVDGGHLSDAEGCQLKSAVEELLTRFGCQVRLTPQQNLLLCDLQTSQRAEVDALLCRRGVPAVRTISNLRRYTMGCTGLPLCSAAITESDRVMPGLLDALEAEVARLDLQDERFTMRVIGCPRGCTRSYLADLAIVGRTIDLESQLDKYAIFVGGDTLGRRLNMLYKDLVPVDRIVPTLVPLLRFYKESRRAGEGFGDFCHRVGLERLRQCDAQASGPES